jgi:hypothetical protein
VKAKSFNPKDENIFIGKNGGLVSGWKPYLFDWLFKIRGTENLSSIQKAYL